MQYLRGRADSLRSPLPMLMRSDKSVGKKHEIAQVKAQLQAQVEEPRRDFFFVCFC